MLGTDSDARIWSGAAARSRRGQNRRSRRGPTGPLRGACAPEAPERLEAGGGLVEAGQLPARGVLGLHPRGNAPPVLLRPGSERGDEAPLERDEREVGRAARPCARPPA